MNALQLQFLDGNEQGQAVSLPISETGIGIVVSEQGLRQTDGDDAQIKLIANDLACWMHVYAERNSVHVNGRPVLRLANLRAGDHLFLDGQRLFVTAGLQERTVNTDSDESMPQFALRGQSADHYGMSIPVAESGITLGSGAKADIRLDDAAIAEQIATLQPTPGGLIYSVAAGVGSQVNGLNTTQGTLEAGDQWLLANKFRFLVESPDFVDILRPDELAAERAAQELDAKLAAEHAARHRLLVRLAWLVGICAAFSALVIALIQYAPK